MIQQKGINFKDSLLLLVAIAILVMVIAIFLFQPPASIEIRDFHWLALRCWLEPCALLFPPRFPWEHFGSVEILNREITVAGGPPQPLAVAIGLDGAIVVGDSAGGVFHFAYGGRHRFRVPYPEIFSPVKSVGLSLNGTIAVTDGKAVLRLKLPDQQWEELPTYSLIASSSLFPSDTFTAVAVGQSGTIVMGDSAGGVYRWTGSEWASLRIPKHEQSSAITAVAVGQSGTIVMGDSAGKVYRWTGSEWASLRMPNREEPFPIIAVAVRQNDTIVARDPTGMVHHWTGSGWKKLNVPSKLAAAKVVTIGPNSTFVTISMDGVVHKWVPITPALLSLLPSATLILVLLLLMFVQVRWRKTVGTNNDKPNVIGLESDVPIEDHKEATKAACTVADRISSFVLNPYASAPLTFALTGKWGSGKSSLMKLVERELRNKHCPSVWFNAWHHQNETHLFAALMECIRLQAVPRFFPTFYLNLVKLRFLEQPIQVILAGLFVLGFPFAIGWLLINSNQGEHIFVPPNLISAADILGVLFGWKTRWNPIRPFGDTPASLVPTSESWFRFHRYQNRLSFRHRFGRAFGEVCKAFPLRRLVILIDDLDRCRPKQVVEILEAVNFLTSSGECFVLLGIDENQVKSAVGLHYKEAAEEAARKKTADQEGGG